MPKASLRQKRLGTKAHFAPTGLEDWSVTVSTHTPVLTDREKALKEKMEIDGAKGRL
jgi:hypothetical protein